MNRATPAELFNASPNQVGNNWEASNNNNMGFQVEDKSKGISPYWRIIEDGGFRVWYHAWYTTLDNGGFHKPFFMTAVYPAQTQNQALFSYAQCNANGDMWLSGPADLNKDVPYGWSISGNAKATDGRSWTQVWKEDYNFSPFLKVLESGNNQAFTNDSKWEKIVFYIERQVTNSPNNVGYEWLRTRANVKPQNKVMYVDGVRGNSATTNTTANGKPGVLKTGADFCVDFDWVGTGNPTHIKLEFIADGQPTIPARYHDVTLRTVNNKSLRKEFMREYFDSNFVKALKPDVQYSLKVTPVYRIKDGFGTYHDFTYSNVSTTISNFVSFDPRPSISGLNYTLKKNGIAIGESTFDIVRDYDLSSKSVTITFNNSSTNGAADRFIARLVDGDGPDIFFPDYNSQHPMGYTCQIPMDRISKPKNTSYYNLEIVFWNSATPNYTTSTKINQIISSRVRPLFAPKTVYWSEDGSTWSSTSVGTYRANKIKLRWSFDKDVDGTNGLANMMQIKLEDKNDPLNYIYIWRGAANYASTAADNYRSHNTSLRQPPFNCEFTVNDVGTNLIGKMLKVTLTPFFCYKYESTTEVTYLESTTSKVLDSYVIFDLGLDELLKVLPTSSDAAWYWEEDTTAKNSQLKIAFVLPSDQNVESGLIDRNTYEYSQLKITYIGKDLETVEKIYTINDNSTELNPTYICVSGDGKLSYQNTVIVDLTGILNANIEPLAPIEETLSDGTMDYYYEVNILVNSNFGTSSSGSSYTIHLKDFPLKLADDLEGGIPSGTLITAENMSKFLEARDIIATYTDKSIAKRPVKFEPIKYDDLMEMVKPINDLYNGTKGWNNIKKYQMPRAIGSNGSQIPGIDAPYYNGTLKNEVYDRIYAINSRATSLTPIESKPIDYEDKYNKYFQQELDESGNPKGLSGYVWRSSTNDIDSDEHALDYHLYSSSEYNVSLSYYALYHSLQTENSIVFPEYYMMQSTSHYDSEDSQTYGGWVSIPDIQLRNDYTYEIDAILTPVDNDRKWTIFGGSYGESGGIKQGLFASFYTDLRLYTNEHATANIGTPVNIDSGIRKIYTLEGVSGSGTDIESTVSSYGDENLGGYVAVTDKEIYSDYTFVVSANPNNSLSARFWTFLGCQTTTKEILYTQYPKGIFLGINNDFSRIESKKVASNRTGSAYEVISYASITSYGTMSEYTLQGNGEHTLLSNGGFYLMNSLNSLTGTPISPFYQGGDALYNRTGSIGEIKVYDANNILIMDFVPETYQGNIGFRDKVDNTFYPSNDNSKFIINSPIKTSNGFMIFAPKDYSLEDGKILGSYQHIDSLYGNYGRIYSLNIYDQLETLLYSFVPTKKDNTYGMLETISSTFYPCNNMNKFYVVQNGEEPNQLLGSMNTSEDENAEEITDDSET